METKTCNLFNWAIHIIMLIAHLFPLVFLLKQNLQCGESVTIEGHAYTISAVTHRYQLRKGKYEPSEKRLDVLSTGRYILNLYLENLLEQSWQTYVIICLYKLYRSDHVLLSSKLKSLCCLVKWKRPNSILYCCVLILPGGFYLVHGTELVVF